MEELAASNPSPVAPFHLKRGATSLHSEVNGGSPFRDVSGQAWFAVLFGSWSLGGVWSIVLLFRQHWLSKRLIDNGPPFVDRKFFVIIERCV